MHISTPPPHTHTHTPHNTPGAARAQQEKRSRCQGSSAAHQGCTAAACAGGAACMPCRRRRAWLRAWLEPPPARPCTSTSGQGGGGAQCWLVCMPGKSGWLRWGGRAVHNRRRHMAAQQLMWQAHLAGALSQSGSRPALSPPLPPLCRKRQLWGTSRITCCCTTPQELSQADTWAHFKTMLEQLQAASSVLEIEGWDCVHICGCPCACACVRISGAQLRCWRVSG